jgi:hypothetical protein
MVTMAVHDEEVKKLEEHVSIYLPALRVVDLDDDGIYVLRGYEPICTLKRTGVDEAMILTTNYPDDMKDFLIRTTYLRGYGANLVNAFKLAYLL